MLIEVAALVGHGVPWDVAMSMPRVRRMAFLVAFGELAGGRYDWSTQQWEYPDG
ncbi:hypothetical protein HNW77_01375 [Komagataeibacter sp. AV436]|uniref:Uncharacterized protein n=1 Tax=Komagataeibacter melomenusus TaxID=2766578 RepID=A0ABX2AB77_9PROT|nr:hypothetical protein [Komagataeibacter melomenusus]MBV1829723.1 hypothetical protein [Komagataeibacter melomenusus]NPC65076.1 hypothetical protein [Komagataeibacter melomenusus]